MSEGRGLKAREIREISRHMRVLPFMAMFFVVPAGAAVGLHWVALAYGAGAALAWSALRKGGTGGFRGRLRRVLAWICERELRIVPSGVVAFGVFQVIAGFVIAPWEGLVAGLWDPEMTKAEIADALVEGLRQVKAEAAPWILLIGVSGAVGALLWGVADWLLLGAIGARLGVRPWRVLFGRGCRQDWRELAVRDRAHRRRLLRGEG